MLVVKKIMGRDNLLNHGKLSVSLPLPCPDAGRTFSGWRSMYAYSLPFAGVLAGGAFFAGFFSAAAAAGVVFLSSAASALSAGSALSSVPAPALSLALSSA